MVFKVGDKVRCIDNGTNRKPLSTIVEGEEYTIIAVRDGELGVKISSTLGWFYRDRFELVVDKDAKLLMQLMERALS